MYKLKKLLNLLQEISGGGHGGGHVGTPGGRLGHSSTRSKPLSVDAGYWRDWGGLGAYPYYCPVGTRWNPSTGKCEKVK